MKHAHEYDPTKILKNMDDMAKRFSEKVAGPTTDIRASRIKEQAGAQVVLSPFEEVVVANDDLASLQEELRSAWVKKRFDEAVGR